jgi:5-methylcytosine-specific restriction endonuclease McrA
MKYRKYTEQQLKDAVKQNTSIRQVLIALGLAPKGGSYRTIHNAIIKYNIDTSHFLGKAWSKNKTLKPRIDTDEYLSNKKQISSFKLKVRLLESSVLSHICSRCNLAEWLGNPIPLELDHIDGDHLNNNLNNLRLLCPNCHALTPNYRGKNIGKAYYYKYDSAQSGT